LVVTTGDMDEEDIDVSTDDLGISFGGENSEQQEQFIKDLKDKKKETQEAQPKKIQLSHTLSELVLTPAKHLDESGLQWHVENGKSYQITSFAEGKGLQFATTMGNLYSQFNSHVMSRIYPKGIRFDSSNYNPLPYWYCGSQIVALNYQTPDEWWRINEGKFMKNGRTGYVIKPECLRVVNGIAVTWEGCNILAEPLKTLKVTVISGWRLAQKKKSKYTTVVVKATLYSCSEPQTDLSEVVDNNLHNPTFNKEFTFNVVHEELDILMLEVFDGPKKNLLYYYSIPVDCMRQGYRTVGLKDPRGVEVKEAELFVKVSLNKKNKKR